MPRSQSLFAVVAAIAILPACAAEVEDAVIDYEFVQPEAAERPDSVAARTEAETPQIRMLLTDAPADVDAVFVTFDQIEVQGCAEADVQADAPADEETDADAECAGTWMTVSEESVTFDLLTLQGGVTADLAAAALPQGEYGQIRLHLSEASVVVDGEEIELTVPSGVLKLNGGFALEDGHETELTIDFDAEHSLHFAPGNGWMMTPVISIVSETIAPMEEDEEPADEEPAEEEPGDDAPTDPQP